MENVTSPSNLGAVVPMPPQIALLLALRADLFDRIPLDRMDEASRTLCDAASDIPAGVCGRLDSPQNSAPRVSFRVDLPGVRRISRRRKCEPPGGHATRRQEQRRIAGGPRLRQNGIDDELFDVTSGFEALTPRG
jgi:hypothetical protein